MADNNYGLNNTINLNQTIAYGASSVFTGFVSPASFNPAYGVSALKIGSLTVSGNNSIPTLSIGTTATLPLEITWDGLVATPTGFFYTVTAGNTTAHATDLTTTTFVRISSYGTALSGGVTGTMIDSNFETADYSTISLATPATYVVNLNAPGLTRTVANGATVTVQGSASVGTFSPAYGVSSLKIASLSVSGNNANVTLGLTTTATIPMTITWNGLTQTPDPIWYTVSIANTGVHGTDLTTNIVVNASSYAVGLSGGALAKLSTDQLFTGTSYTLTAIGDTTPPSGVSAFTATAGQSRVMLGWINPTNLDFAQIELTSDLDSPPASQGTGTVLYSGTNQSYEHLGVSGLTVDQTVYYSIFSQDNAGNWSALSASTTAAATPFANNIYGSGIFPYLTNAQIRGRFFDEGII